MVAVTLVKSVGSSSLFKERNPFYREYQSFVLHGSSICMSGLETGRFTMDPSNIDHGVLPDLPDPAIKVCSRVISTGSGVWCNCGCPLTALNLASGMPVRAQSQLLWLLSTLTFCRKAAHVVVTTHQQ